jgi:hypothetical protein
MVEESGTLEGLADRLGDVETWGVLHLTCHGKVNPPTVLLETDTGAERRASPTELLGCVGSHPVRLVFASACDTATWDPDAKTSFTDALVRGGAHTAMGFASKVPDADATQVGAALHARLARGDALALALAEVRRERASDPDLDPRAWASCRCFTQVTPGALVGAASRRVAWKLVRRANPEAFLKARGRSIPVAPRTRFVGRRPLLQKLIRAITERGSLGAAVLGIGGAGKSSLVLRALTRVALRPVVFYKVISRPELLQALREACADLPTVSEALTDDEVKRAGGEEWSYRALVQRVLALDVLRDHPLVFVLDDAESELEDDAARGVKRLKKEPRDTITGLMDALGSVPEGRSRVVITSRYAFEIPDRRGRDLFEDLVRIDMAGMTRGDAEKLLQQADRYDVRGVPRKGASRALAEDLRARCLRAGAENPRFLALLHTALTESPKRGAAVLAEVERYLKEGHRPGDPEVVRHLEGLVIDELLKLVGDAGRVALRALTVFSIGLPISLATQTVDESPELIERLVDLSLLERDTEGMVRVPLLVRPALGVEEPDTRKYILTRFFDALPDDWREDAEGGWNGPLDRALCLFALAPRRGAGLACRTSVAHGGERAAPERGGRGCAEASR